ncbi:MAG TPA: ABC transporter substrate-binding protein [Anaeromyxobacteraceae bacterium]|nr:ABC transporter substrate-binding protein [Anaeromyxobacteraceae bacterium]
MHGTVGRSALSLSLVLAGLLLPAAGRAANPPGDGEVLFGISAPFSGTTREYGRQLKVGFEVAFALANDAGGVAGRKLRLVARDDGYDPPRTVAAVKELVENEKVFGLVGVFGSANSAAVLPYVLERQVPYFAPYSGAGLLRNDPPDRYVFNYRPSYAEEAAAAVRYLVEVRRLRPNQIAVMHQDDPFGEAGWSGVAKVMRKYKRDPGQVVRVTYPRNTADVDAAVATIRQNAPRLKAVVMVAVYKPAYRFIEKLRAAGLDLVFTNVSAVSATELAEQIVPLGPSYTKDVLVTQIVPLPTSRATALLRYQEALKKYAPAERPDFVSLEAYLAGSVLVEGLKRAGRKLDAEAFVDALEGIRNLDLGIGVPLGFGPSEHQASRKVWGTVLEPGGGWKAIDLE